MDETNNQQSTAPAEPMINEVEAFIKLWRELAAAEWHR